jgi:hypothetical protein
MKARATDERARGALHYRVRKLDAQVEVPALLVKALQSSFDRQRFSARPRHGDQQVLPVSEHDFLRLVDVLWTDRAHFEPRRFDTVRSSPARR